MSNKEYSTVFLVDDPDEPWPTVATFNYALAVAIAGDERWVSKIPLIGSVDLAVKQGQVDVKEGGDERDS